MAILPPGIPKTYQLQPGETLSITTDSVSICRYGQSFSAPDAVAPGAAISVPASSSVVAGPLATVSRWIVDGIVGPGCTVVQNSAQSVPDFGAPLDVCHLFGNGAPTAATGANQAAIGSLYTDTTNAKLYINGGTKATPSWRIVTSA
jgi:hypothetical protein